MKPQLHSVICYSPFIIRHQSHNRQWYFKAKKSTRRQMQCNTSRIKLWDSIHDHCLYKEAFIVLIISTGSWAVIYLHTVCKRRYVIWCRYEIHVFLFDVRISNKSVVDAKSTRITFRLCSIKVRKDDLLSLSYDNGTLQLLFLLYCLSWA